MTPRPPGAHLLGVLLYRLIDLYSLLVVVSMILSWIPSAGGHPATRFVESLTQPVLSKIRAVVPPFGGWDVSGMILLVALRLLQRLLYF